MGRAQTDNSSGVLTGAASSNKTVSSTRGNMLESSCVARLSSARNLIARVGETVILSIGQAALAFLFTLNTFDLVKLPNLSQLTPVVSFSHCTDWEFSMHEQLPYSRKATYCLALYMICVLTEMSSILACIFIGG